MLALKITSFAYDEQEVLRNIAFQLDQGEHLAVLGESGCGKSTLLHIIYGLLDLEHGTLHWKDKALLGPKHNLIPGQSFMKLVSQEFNVMPFISVSENIATHLNRLDLEKDTMRVEELLKVVDLVEFAHTKVKNLSGGQKQRVALAKALAKKPELLLLDEPFSNIDTFRKNKLRRNLYHYLKEQNITCITATHDSEEALAFSDRMLLMKEGLPVSFGTPETVYGNISTPYQAGFFGEINEIPAGIFSSEALVLLPHQLSISEEKTKLTAKVIQSYFKGSHYLIHARHEEVELYFNHPTQLIKAQNIFLDRLPN